MKKNQLRSEKASLYYSRGRGSAPAHAGPMAAAAEQEKKYRLLFEKAGTAILLADTASGKIIDANPAAERLLGRTRRELIGLNRQKIHPPEEAGYYKKHFRKHAAHGAVNLDSAVVVKKNGRRIPVKISATTVTLNGRKTLFGMFHDATAHTRAEEALRESEARYRTLFDRAPDGIAIMPMDGSKLIVNRSFARMHGYGAPEEMLHLRLSDLDTPETAKLAPGRLRRIRTSGEPVSFEVEHRHRDGHGIFLNVTGNIIHIDGKPHFIGFHHDITESKRAEAAAQKQTAILKAQQAGSPDGILVVDKAGRIVSCNRHFVSMWGIPPAIIASGSDKRALQAVLRKLTDPRSFLNRVNYLYRHNKESSREDISLKDGRTFERHSSPALGENGEFYGRIWYFRDITHRKKTEELLAANERKYRTLLEASFDLIYVIGRDDTVQYVNPAAIKYLRLSPAEIIGRRRASFFPPEVSAQQKRGLDWVFSKNKPLFREQGIKTTQDIRYQETHLIPLKGPDGRTDSVLGISRDITERKRLENVLKESEETLRTIFDTAKDAIFIKDLDGRYTKANRACAEVLSTTPEKVVGRTDAQLFSPEQAAYLNRSDQEVIRTGKTITMSFERRLPSGNAYVNTIKTPLRNSKNEITGVLGVARDVTKLKKMEAELALARALEAVSTKTRPIAHDFNNALAAINGYATLINEELDGKSPIKTEIEMIIKGVRRAAKITAKLQKYARNPQLSRGSK